MIDTLLVYANSEALLEQIMDPADIPVPSPSYSPFTRIGTTVQANAWRLSGQSGLAVGHRWKRQPNPETSPTFTKTFARYPEILCRVFIPRPEACLPGRLPCYISVHGGGFVLGTPEMDDFFGSYLAEKGGICVVLIGYRKAPKWKFPTAVNDVAGITAEILDGDSLPIDRSRICLGGFSTGASLALAAVQTETLSGRIQGVVAFSPMTDMTVAPEDKLASSAGEGDQDRLGKEFAYMIQKAYVPSETDLKNPLLSPLFASRGKLPPNVYIVGAEEDMLCAEAERMAVSLAGQEDEGWQWKDTDNGWEKGGIKWELMKGWQHNFTHLAEKGIRESERRFAVDQLFDRVARWLWGRAFLLQTAYLKK